ncbi:hypothetical protein AA23498_1203 [Acetobacter nitrogenifigens DSM 23921 = NBRC 105050]|uniref:Uncharacterized protein n=1 Tax=Acetobacter nitrogenifigens DSM 23921 = NBRC 105050 TaxID=1120919 RepID=A0A511XD05_9PROT|nr:hypothetical protein [Acetobacter nitrogenifigens]GBQ91514.1 hypothetical protein AA23498_1203 [Acetobacter nitrogenifigens DSM 23921 = NBRC 105050]GEN60846.1 hypothetical protein ANI02nite_27300 [Acetobacter nitrogenifigens DSM 23921 = NBRC 105050]
MTEAARTAIRKASDDVADIALILTMLRVPQEVTDSHGLERAIHWLGRELDLRAAAIMEAQEG